MIRTRVFSVITCMPFPQEENNAATRQQDNGVGSRKQMLISLRAYVTFDAARTWRMGSKALRKATGLKPNVSSVSSRIAGLKMSPSHTWHLHHTPGHGVGGVYDVVGPIVRVSEGRIRTPRATAQ